MLLHWVRSKEIILNAIRPKPQFPEYCTSKISLSESDLDLTNSAVNSSTTITDHIECESENLRQWRIANCKRRKQMKRKSRSYICPVSKRKSISLKTKPKSTKSRMKKRKCLKRDDLVKTSKERLFVCDDNVKKTFIEYRKPLRNRKSTSLSKSVSRICVTKSENKTLHTKSKCRDTSSSPTSNKKNLSLKIWSSKSRARKRKRKKISSLHFV